MNFINPMQVKFCKPPSWGAWLLSFVFCPFALADLARQHQTFDRLLLPGGRAAMLGGAYTSLADDPSGLLYNPAGSAFIEQSQVSLNSWSTFKSHVQFKEAINGQDFTEQSNTRFGGFAGGLFKQKPFTLGYVITTLDKRNINQEDYFRDISTEDGQATNFTRIHQESNNYDLFGISLAFTMGKHWSFGLAGFYFDRSIEAMDYQQVEFNGGEVLVQESKIRVTNQGIQGIGGLQYRGDDFNFGLSLRRGEALINRGRLNFNSVTHPIASSKPVIVSFSDDNYDNDAEIIPDIYRAGLAWHPSTYFLLSTEASHSSFVKVTNGSPDRLAVWNYAAGLESGWNQIKFMLGVFTNKSNFAPTSGDSADQTIHLDYIGRTIGTSLFTKSFDIYLGYVRQEGKGMGQILSASLAQQEIAATLENVLISWNFKL